MLTLYFAPHSTANLTRIALAELGVPVEYVKLDLAAGDARAAAFLELNPNGRVPVLVHDGQAIFESAAIAMYLGETFGVERRLYPEPGPQRGVAMQWIVWSNVTLTEPVQRALRAGSPYSPAELHHAATAAGGRADVADRLRILDAALADRPYVLGAAYSLVDAHLAGTVGWIASLEMLPPGLANLGGWLDRCGARPAFAAAREG